MEQSSFLFLSVLLSLAAEVSELPLQSTFETIHVVQYLIEFDHVTGIERVDRLQTESLVERLLCRREVLL